MSGINQRPSISPQPQPFQVQGLPTVADVAAPVPVTAPAPVPTPTPEPEVPLKTDGLSPEEIGYLQEGLLPANYADLKAVMATHGVEAARELGRRGIQGPFSPGYGDPRALLNGARRTHQNPELLRMFQSLKKGDILSQAWEGGLQDIIPIATKGPFSHTLLCVSTAPPEFIEAVGLTGNSAEATNNLVRRTTFAEQAQNSLTQRVQRPTEGMGEAEAHDAIKRAVSYAEKQLGKPYDYSFTNRNTGIGLTDAFYCSELTYLAYVSPQGANVPVPLRKSPDRDAMMKSIAQIVTALEPYDQAALMDKAAKHFSTNQNPSMDDVLNYLVDGILPECKATAGVFVSLNDRDRLKGALKTMIEGKGFPRFEARYAQFRQAEKRPEYKWPVIGTLLRAEGRLEIGWSMVRDCFDFCKSGGIKFFAALKASVKILMAVMPHAEPIAKVTLGANNPTTQGLKGLMDRMDWLKGAVGWVPILRDHYPLPARPAPSLKTDFVSPSDMAWADVPHWDFNVKPTFSIEAPTP
jgi:hypothetical protein